MKADWNIKAEPESMQMTLADENPREFVRAFLERFDSRQILLISQPAVLEAWGTFLEEELRRKDISFQVHRLPDGEEAKSLKTIERLWRFFAKTKVSRKTPVVALGGGSVTDAAGFAASTYHRGLPLVLVPTTLMGQIDSAIGGKTAINFRKTKNNIGSFYFPEWVYANPRFLATLPPRQWRSGMAEMIKAAVIQDAELFGQLETEDPDLLMQDSMRLFPLMERAIAVKIALVGQDPWDQLGVRAKLNFGHTVGHAIESASEFRDYTHGEAVSLGMWWESQMSVRLGECRASEAERLEKLLLRYQLPAGKEIPDQWRRYFLRDKKRTGRDLSFVFLSHIGQTVVKSVSLRCIQSF